MDLTFDKLAIPDLPTLPPRFHPFETLDVAPSPDVNSVARVAARQRMNEFQDLYKSELDAGGLTPAPYEYTHHFSDPHPVFGCAMYGRELALPAGAIIVGKIHKYPVLNVLLKGQLVVVSETGRKHLTAPATYMSEPGVRRVGYVVEDCVWLNVLMTDKVGEEHLDEIADFHTAESYADIGLEDSVEAVMAKIKNGGA